MGQLVEIVIIPLMTVPSIFSLGISIHQSWLSVDDSRHDSPMDFWGQNGRFLDSITKPTDRSPLALFEFNCGRSESVSSIQQSLP